MFAAAFELSVIPDSFSLYLITASIISDSKSPSISDLPCRDLLYPASLSSSGQPRNQLLFSSLTDNRQQTVDFESEIFTCEKSGLKYQFVDLVRK